jgi:hypothetical protein
MAYLALSFATTAEAALVTYAFEGTVDGVGLPVFGISPAMGSRVTGSFSYDTSIAPWTSGTFYSHYQIYSPYSLVAEIGGTRIESGGIFSISIQNDFGGNVEDTISIGAQPALIAGTQTADGVFGLNFASRNANTFSSLSLPEHLILADFNAWRYGVLTRAGNNNEIITFSVDRLTPVALPGAATMLLTGLAMIAAVGRWRLEECFGIRIRPISGRSSLASA